MFTFEQVDTVSECLLLGELGVGHTDPVAVHHGSQTRLVSCHNWPASHLSIDLPRTRGSHNSTIHLLLCVNPSESSIVK